MKNQERGLNQLLKFIQGPKEAITVFFFQRLISDGNRIISDLKVRQILIQCLDFENAYPEGKSVIRPFKARSAPIETQLTLHVMLTILL